MSTPAANIGPVGRRRRLLVGAAVLVLTAAAAVLLAVTGTERWIRLLLLLPFLLGALGVFQARESTCVVLARRGTRDLDGGEESLEDPDLAAALRRRAARVWAFAAGAAALLTVAALVLPG